MRSILPALGLTRRARRRLRLAFGALGLLPALALLVLLASPAGRRLLRPPEAGAVITATQR